MIKAGTSPNTIPAMKPIERPVETKGDDLVHRNSASLPGRILGSKMAAPQDFSPPAGQSTEKEDDDWEYIDLKADNSSYLMQQDELNNNSANTPSTQPAIKPWHESHNGIQENRQTVTEILGIMKMGENDGRTLNISESLGVALAPRGSRLLDGLRRTFSFTRTLETHNLRLNNALCNALRREFEPCWCKGGLENKFTETFDRIRNFIGKAKSGNFPKADDIAKTIAENLRALEKRLADEHNINTKGQLALLDAAVAKDDSRSLIQAQNDLNFALEILDVRYALLANASAYENKASHDQNTELSELASMRIKLREANAMRASPEPEGNAASTDTPNDSHGVGKSVAQFRRFAKNGCLSKECLSWIKTAALDTVGNANDSSIFVSTAIFMLLNFNKLSEPKRLLEEALHELSSRIKESNMLFKDKGIEKKAENIHRIDLKYARKALNNNNIPFTIKMVYKENHHTSRLLGLPANYKLTPDVVLSEIDKEKCAILFIEDFAIAIARDRNGLLYIFDTSTPQVCALKTINESDEDTEATKESATTKAKAEKYIEKRISQTPFHLIMVLPEKGEATSRSPQVGLETINESDLDTEATKESATTKTKAEKYIEKCISQTTLHPIMELPKEEEEEEAISRSPQIELETITEPNKDTETTKEPATTKAKAEKYIKKRIIKAPRNHNSITQRPPWKY